MIKKGDIVGRVSHNKDLIFKVEKIIKSQRGENFALIKGITERIEEECNLEELYILNKEVAENQVKKIEKKLDGLISKKEKQKRYGPSYVNGKILHLDGDKKYSEKSIKYYKKMGLNAIVKNVPEYRQPHVIYSMLEIYRPDILVVTGHDGILQKDKNYNDIYNYRNSKYFIQTVREARRYSKEYGVDLAIFAGACQSYFEALIMEGANFASSPARIMIDILDPLIVAEKIAKTDIFGFITIDDIQGDLRDGKRGVGGIGATGKRRYKIDN